MKKTKFIQLVLITSALASCHQKAKQKEWQSEQKVYMRSDSSAGYTQSHYHRGIGNWYYAFRPYGYYYQGSYNRIGYYSSGISEHSNIGSSAAKSGAVRGGFGSPGASVSS